MNHFSACSDMKSVCCLPKSNMQNVIFFFFFSFQRQMIFAVGKWLLALILTHFVGLILISVVHPDLIVLHYGKSCFKLGCHGHGTLGWYELSWSNT